MSVSDLLQIDQGLILQIIPEKSSRTPLTTCFIYKLCQSTERPVFTPGSYRLSLEPNANLKANTVRHEAIAPPHKAKYEPDFVGRGDEGQRLICLVDLELLYEGYFERLAGHVTIALTPLHTFTHIIESLYPETRSVPSLPGVLIVIYHI